MYNETDAALNSALAETRVPLTEAQREIWYASQMSAGASLAYHESMTLRLTGPLSVGALRRALRLLVARHEALRTRIGVNGDAQRILGSGEIELTMDELPDATPPEERESRANKWLETQLQQPFDLAGGALFRTALLRLDDRTHLFSVIVHHVICDGWSLGVLTREVGRIYAAEREGRSAELAVAPSLSAEIERQSAERKSPAFEAAREFWTRQFTEPPPWLELPTDRPRAANRSYRGALLTHVLSTDLSTELKKVCSVYGCTMFTGLLASFCILIHRLAGQDDVVIGVPSATQVMGGVGGLVGNFANLLPFRSRIGDNPSFYDYLARVREQLTCALDHWRFPFGSVLELLNLPRDPSRVPLAPVVFNSTGTHATFEFGGLCAEVQPAPKHFVNFDLSFNFGAHNGGIVLGCYYSTELYDRETIERWFGHFETLLRGTAAEPGRRLAELPLLTAAEHQLMRGWNETAMEFRRDATIHQLFEEQVTKSPSAIAVVAGSDRLSFADLNRRANSLAAQLAEWAVCPDAPVGIFLERTAQLPAAILGVLKAGAAYVPLDPTLPAQRLAFVVDDARMEVIVTQQSLVGRLPPTTAKLVLMDGARVAPAAADGAKKPNPMVRAENLAYIMYTSGSTGRPKGVCVCHRNVVALVAWAQREYSARELDGVLFATSASFDVSILESLVPLCLGGKIVLAQNILEIATAASTAEIRMISGVPSAIAEVLRAGLIPETVTTMMVGGEYCPQFLVDALLQQTRIARVFDLYGPTETTVYSSGCVRLAGGRATIGRPFANERMYILDTRLQPVPIGVSGELFIGGEKVARGYLNRPQLTREKFIESPLDPAGRIYRTGDRARFYPDGSIEYLGRLDDQVKVRGFRIELGEIESVLRQHPAVNDCVVMVRQDSAGMNWLAGYVVPATAGMVTLKSLQQHLQQQLPEYMVPAAFVLLEKLPLTANGKINRRALPEPEVTGEGVDFVAPKTATEEIVAEIWREVLQTNRVGLNHNFFELGGHSLRATQVITRLNQVLGIDVSMRQFFHAPTVAGLSAVVDAALVDEIQAGSPADTSFKSESAPVLVK